MFASFSGEEFQENRSDVGLWSESEAETEIERLNKELDEIVGQVQQKSSELLQRIRIVSEFVYEKEQMKKKLRERKERMKLQQQDQQLSDDLQQDEQQPAWTSSQPTQEYAEYVSAERVTRKTQSTPKKTSQKTLKKAPHSES
eukprot:TRINITY_DN2269_c0_g1_i3.p1 TRINITY_DN2269_c0_g1~~TRINITY_DN2269_c0_g1_i3.p1  ORF type:complete len:143 (-),score=50.73 TRINITY_DN2269_c0_g1_i3:196-624(-)